MAIALGLAMREGRRLYEEEKRAKNELEEWEARKPLREALANMQMMEAQEYMGADSAEARRLQRQMVAQGAKEFLDPAAMGLRRETQALQADTVREERARKWAAAVLLRNADAVKSSPNGFISTLNEINNLTPERGQWKLSPEDKDGYQNGLLLELVDANGNVIQKQHFADVTDGGAALRELGNYTMTGAELASWERAQYSEQQKALAELAKEQRKYKHEWNLKQSELANSRYIKTLELQAEHAMTDEERYEAIAKIVGATQGMVLDDNGIWRMYDGAAPDPESMPVANAQQVKGITDSVNKVSVNLSNSGTITNVYAAIADTLGKEGTQKKMAARAEEVGKMTPQEKQARADQSVSKDFGIFGMYTPEQVKEVAKSLSYTEGFEPTENARGIPIEQFKAQAERMYGAGVPNVVAK